jgi:prophage antirepressor-like protein
MSIDTIGIIDINEFFNELEVRIVGTPEEPYFYCCDVARILGIQNPRPLINSYEDHEQISQETRKEMNIVTRNSLGAVDNSISLLSEAGIYRMLFTSRKSIAIKFRKFVCDLLKSLRLKTKERLRTELSSFVKRLNEYEIENINLKKENTSVKSRLHFSEIASDLQSKIVEKYRHKNEELVQSQDFTTLLL